MTDQPTEKYVLSTEGCTLVSQKSEKDEESTNETTNVYAKYPIVDNTTVLPKSRFRKGLRT